MKRFKKIKKWVVEKSQKIKKWFAEKTEFSCQKVDEIFEDVKETARPAREKVAKVTQNKWVKPVLNFVGSAFVTAIIVKPFWPTLASINPVLPFIAAGIIFIWQLYKTDIKQQARYFVKTILKELALDWYIEQKQMIPLAA